VAKVEKKSPESSLPYEYKAYCRFSSLTYVPSYYFFGDQSGYYCLVLENVGTNMEEFFQLRKEILPGMDTAGLAATVAMELVSSFAFTASTGTYVGGD